MARVDWDILRECLDVVRLAAGLEPADLATKMGVPYSTVSRIIKGEVDPSLVNIEKWSRACDRSLAQFFRQYDALTAGDRPNERSGKSLKTGPKPALPPDRDEAPQISGLGSRALREVAKVFLAASVAAKKSERLSAKVRGPGGDTSKRD